MQTIGEIQKKVRNASKLRITNLGSAAGSEILNMISYSGVVEYFPEELVITVKAGTLIKEINQVLGENNQALPFFIDCLLYASPSPRDVEESRMPSSA